MSHIVVPSPHYVTVGSSQIGGVPNSELNTLELEFLFLTNFDLHVKRKVYDRYRECLLEWGLRTGNADSQLAELDSNILASYPKGCISEVHNLHRHKTVMISDELRMDMDKEAQVDAMVMD